MKKKLFKGFIILVLGFTGLFALRLGYGYLTFPPGDQTIDNISHPPSFNNNLFSNEDIFSLEGQRRSSNIATSYKKKTFSQGGQTKTVTVDQKYEKVANLSSATKNYEEDEKTVRKTIVEYDALIQGEQNSGLEGNRVLYLTIGVDPEKFDDMVEKLHGIGKTQSIQINKKDKTNEFLNLQAQLTTLEKTRNSLQELKSRSGTIEELVDLENQILEVERKIQNLGVSLGKFDEENEFCTVNFTLYEYKVTVVEGIPFLQRIVVAGLWTVEWFAKFIILLLFSTFALWLTYSLLQKLKWLPGWLKDRWQRMK